MNKSSVIRGVLVDPVKRDSFGAEISIEGGVIVGVKRNDSISSPFILPGMVDSHVHIESSMLTPFEFSRAAARQGTIAAVCDPHEIANVAGVDGVDFMISNSNNAIIKLFFGVPSCVPASPFDECFKPFSVDVVEGLIKRDDLLFLGEMMNFPGVIYDSESVHGILNATKKCNKPIDGHAPALSGDELKKYVSSGISTDHECFTMNEANEKINLGMKVLIREGSAAKNYNQLKDLVNTNPEMVMFCTDDCHPDDLEREHINKLLKKSTELGYDLYNILQVTTINPIKHYNLNVGYLQIGQPADFIIVDNLKDFNIKATFINGNNVFDSKTKSDKVNIPNYVFPSECKELDLEVIAKTNKFKAIEIINDELVTNEIHIASNAGKPVRIDTKNDILKIVVVSRYIKNKYSVGFIKGVGLKKGAMAASIAHDSHHIIAIGADDFSINRCINYIIENRGGVCYFDTNDILGLPLPVFGLMTNSNVTDAGEMYSAINKKILSDGCSLKAPFMTMAFMSLTVIPKLKITPDGLFDVVAFKPTEMFIE